VPENAVFWLLATETPLQIGDDDIAELLHEMGEIHHDVSKEASHRLDSVYEVALIDSQFVLEDCIDRCESMVIKNDENKPPATPSTQLVSHKHTRPNLEVPCHHLEWSLHLSTQRQATSS